jgi:hypothetical protein
LTGGELSSVVGFYLFISPTPHTSCLKMTDPLHKFFLQLKANRTWSCCVIQVTNLLVPCTCTTDVSTLCHLNITYTLHALWWSRCWMLGIGDSHLMALIHSPKYCMDMICIEIVCMQLFRYNFFYLSNNTWHGHFFLSPIMI